MVGGGMPGPEIFLIGYSLLNERLVKHEMLHQILHMLNKKQEFMKHHQLFKTCNV